MPTFLLVAALHFYLKYMFFGPLERVLHTRYEATEGARKRAEQALETAAAKAAEFDAAMRAARAEVYQMQEKLHRELQDQRARDLGEARARAERAIAEARAQLAADVAEARSSLERHSQELAELIANTVLNRSAA